MWDHAKDIDVVMRMYNLIEWQYYTYEPSIGNNNNIIDVPDSASFKFKQK